MRWTILLFVLACLMSVPHGGSVAQDPPRDAPRLAPGDKEATPAEKQLEQAHALLKPLSKKTYAILRALRYLLRNEFEDDVFAGRWRPTCPIEPFEKAGSGPLDLAEQLRLWVVLETGLARNPAIDAALARLRDTPVPEAKNDLALVGLYMLVVRAAASRMTVTESAKLLENARQIATAAKNEGNACSPQSVWVSGDSVSIEWFSNHFWRAVINRCSLDLGQPAQFKQWGRDLDFLGRAYFEKLGWTCQKDQPRNVMDDLNANLLSMASFGIAAGAPIGQFSKQDLRVVETAASRMPEVLTRLQTTYPDDPFSGARLALLLSCTAAPQGLTDGLGWRNLLLVRHMDMMTSGDAPGFKTGISGAFGFTSGDARPDKLAEIAEISFGLVALCGGFLRQGEGPLAKTDLAEIARLMQAMALVEAASAPAQKPLTPLQIRVNRALDNARAFLAKVQNPDGSFPGDYWGGPKMNATGAQCLAVLALLHAGEPRESVTIQRAIRYLEGKDYIRNFPVYEASLQLMMMEKYFEKEIAASGMFEATNINEYNDARNKLVGLLPKGARDLAKNCTNAILSKHQLDSEGFSYSCGGKGEPPRVPPAGGPPGQPIPPPPPQKSKTMQPAGSGYHEAWAWDNSNSQFAVMGLKAACMLAINVPSKIFRSELERICTTATTRHEPMVRMERPWKMAGAVVQKKGPRQPTPIERANCYKIHYRPDWEDYFDVKPGKKQEEMSCGSYGCTGGNVGSLAICLDELKLRSEWRGDAEVKLEKKSDEVLWGGLSWIALHMLGPSKDFYGRDYKNQWQTDLTDVYAKTIDGVGFYYDAWSLSRACNMLGATILAGGVDWYSLVATKICDQQLKEGGWGLNNFPQRPQDKSTLCNTAFAILVLTRASQPVLTSDRRGKDAPPRGPSRTSEPGKDQPKKGPATGD